MPEDEHAVALTCAEAVVTPLWEQLDHQRARGDRAEQEVVTLRAELVELLISERAAGDIAEYATDEVGELRKRLDASERRADRADRRADAERTRAELRIAELMMPWWRRWFRW